MWYNKIRNQNRQNMRQQQQETDEIERHLVVRAALHEHWARYFVTDDINQVCADLQTKIALPVITAVADTELRYALNLVSKPYEYLVPRDADIETQAALDYLLRTKRYDPTKLTRLVHDRTNPTSHEDVVNSIVKGISGAYIAAVNVIAKEYREPQHEAHMRLESLVRSILFADTRYATAAGISHPTH